MKILRLTLIVIMTLFIMKSFSQVGNDSIIYWDKNIKLKWRDFHGMLPDSALKIKDIACTCCQYPFSYKSCFDYKVVVYFEKNCSWTKDTISNDLLNHEQGHFDFTEISGRKIRRYLHDYCEGEIEQINDVEIDEIILENNVFQDKYDFETKHGTNKIVQKKWNEIIRKELEKLKYYEVNYLEYINE
jgi:hypothetical protein